MSPVTPIARCPNGLYEYPCRMIDRRPEETVTEIDGETIYTYGAAPAGSKGAADIGMTTGCAPGSIGFSGYCVSYLWLGAAAIAGWYFFGRKRR